MKNAVFCSVWDGGFVLESACKIDEETREIYDIATHDTPVEILEKEYVIIDGEEHPASSSEEYNGNGYYYK